MRVLMVGPTKTKGGMATVINGYLEDEVLNEDIEVESYASFLAGSFLFRLFYSLIAFLRFTLIYKKYDIFHLHMAAFGSTYRIIFYIRFLKMKGKKIVVHNHGGEYQEFWDSLTTKRREYVRKHLQKADLYLALSENWKLFFEDVLSLKGVRVLGNAIDVQQYADSRNNPDLYKHAFLFLGLIGENKGVYDLINAIELIKNDSAKIKCYISGPGEIEKVKEIVSKKGLNDIIEVLGYVNQQEKQKLFSNVATLVLPSYSEGLPMVILEAMAAGKTIISTGVGAISELINNQENGLIISPGDVDALKESMLLITQGKMDLHKIQQKNINKIFKKYNKRENYQCLKNLYIELIER